MQWSELFFVVETNTTSSVLGSMQSEKDRNVPFPPHPLLHVHSLLLLIHLHFVALTCIEQTFLSLMLPLSLLLPLLPLILTSFSLL